MKFRTLALLLLFVGAPASAYQFSLDNFQVSRNGATLFNDQFDDGSVPPVAPNTSSGKTVTYKTKGTFTAETGGKLVLDSAGATTGSNNFLVQKAKLGTSTDSSDLTSGLKTGSTFTVTGVFDLTAPGALREAYGVMLDDSTSTYTGNDELRILVRRTGSGNLVVELRHCDWTTNIRTQLAAVALDTSHQQIKLMLSKDSADSNMITASFAYVDNGTAGAITTLGSKEIFHGEAYTRAGFIAFTPVAAGAAQGDMSNLTLSADLKVDPDRRNQTGYTYLAAFVNGLIYAHNGTTWVLWSGGPLPAYSSGPLADLTIPVVDKANLSSLGNITVYAGYGLSQDDMLANQTYSMFYSSDPNTPDDLPTPPEKGE